MHRMTTLRKRKIGSVVQQLCVASADLLVPASCCLCGAAEVRPLRGLCGLCINRLTADDTRLCPRCASFVNPYTIYRERCAHCRSLDYRFDNAVTLGPYDGDLRDTIVRMKQSAEQSLTFAMGQMVGERAITRLGDDLPDYVMPVPMHWFRRIFRTTNSPDFVAAGIAHVLGRKVTRRLLTARRATKKQSMLTPTERAKNVSQAFRCRAENSVEGRHVAVVDDIITTGATMNELARVLKRRRVAA